MSFRERYNKSQHGYGPVTLWVVIPLLTLIVPVIALVTGVRRRRPSDEGMSISEFGWENMLLIWLLLLAFIYLIYIPFVAPADERRRQRRMNQ